MIKSVIVVPSASSGKRSATAGNDAKTAKSEQSREKCVDKTVSSRSGGSSSATQCKSSLPVKVDDRKKLDNKNLKEASASCPVISIDGKTKLDWPVTAVKQTSTLPPLSFSCNPSFYHHSLSLSKEDERHRTDLFIISDILDEIIDVLEYSPKPKHMKHKSKSKSKKKKHKEKQDAAAKQNAVESTVGTKNVQAQSSKLKKKKSKKRQKTPKSTRQTSQEVDLQQTAAVIEVEPTKSIGTPEVNKSLSPANGESLKVEKRVKRLKRLKKKVLSSTTDEALAPSPVKKAKPAVTATKDGGDSNQQRITIAFNQPSGKLSTTKSKWDTSSDEEGPSRKGAISYRFSEESENENPVKPDSAKTNSTGSKGLPFGKMQPGGMLKTIEINNPLPDLKPSVPIAHPNPGPDTRATKSRSRSRTRSRSRSRTRSRSYSYSSDDSYYRSRKGRKRGRRHRRSYSRSYSRSRSRSYSSSRSRSRSYSRSYSRSTSRSRSRYRSYSRSSYSTYSSASYSSRSRSRSPRYTRAVQPKYNNTRAYKLGKRKKFNKKKNQYKNQQNQQAHQNPNIQKQLETGRAKAEETVMRLKKQKEEQQDLQKRAMASIAAAASSAGIPLPKSTAQPTAPSTAVSTASPNATTTGFAAEQLNAEVTDSNGLVNGGSNDLIGSFEAASQLASAPAFIPRPFQKGEFIGPVRPGMDSDIPLPEGAPTRNFSQDNQQKEKEPEPMAAPDETDETYKNLQEQAMQHVHGTTTSPTTEQLQQQLAVTHYAMPDGTTFIDPATGQAIQLAPAFPGAQAIHPHQLMLAHTQQLQLQHTQSPVTPDGDQVEAVSDGKPAPHEAVIKSYAHQIFMSQQKALVSQSQPTFTVASSASSIPQPAIPLQSAPVMVSGAQAAQLQLQAQVQQLQQAQAAQAQAQVAAQMQAIQAQQMQHLQLASLGLAAAPQALAVQPHLQQVLAQQQLMQAQAAQGLAASQLIQLPNGQVVVTANPAAVAAHPMMLRYPRPL